MTYYLSFRTGHENAYAQERTEVFRRGGQSLATAETFRMFRSQRGRGTRSDMSRLPQAKRQIVMNQGVEADIVWQDAAGPKRHQPEDLR